MKRQHLFTLIAFSIPLIIVFSAEWLLRIANVGREIPVFVEAKSVDGYHMINPSLIQRFFPLGANTPKVSPDTYYFKLAPPADTIRIVLMGGSTAAGFPYGRFGSPAGLLTHQLRAIYPEQDIEVIPVAMASINSYALRDMADEVISVKPDAVLIYAGHNEYLGVMGVGSAHANQGSHVTNLLFLSLKNSRLFQLLQAGYQALFSPAKPAPQAQAKTGRTTMATMAKEQNIPFDSPLYHAGLKQFRWNMHALVAAFKDQDIPVFLGNLVANEKHQRPFASVDSESFLGLQTTLNNPAVAEANIQTLQHLNDTLPYSANQHFTLAQLYQSESKLTESLQAFVKAKDYDLLRFRAPSAFNQILADLSADNGVFAVDMVSSFRQESGGAIGDTLMLEHLHPTERGYFLLADAFLQSLVDYAILPKPTYPLSKSRKLRYQQLPLNAVDKGVAAFKIAQLKADYPFTDTPVQVPLPAGNGALTRWIKQRIDDTPWLEQQKALLVYFQRNKQWLQAANVAALMTEAIPQQHQTAMVAAKLYLQAQQPRLAWYYARTASKGMPDNESLHLSLAEAQYLSEDNSAARNTLKKILSFAPNSERAKFYLKQLETQ